VAISKANGDIETKKYRGKELLPFAAFGRDFRNAMIHATIQGLGAVNVNGEELRSKGIALLPKGGINRSCFSCVPSASPTLP
jgi:hypothetical protein